MVSGETCESGMACTDGDERPLSADWSVTVPGPDTQPTPLTASFADIPSEHDGSSAFPVRIAFSETLKNGALGAKVVRIGDVQVRASCARDVAEREQDTDQIGLPTDPDPVEQMLHVPLDRDGAPSRDSSDFAHGLALDQHRRNLRLRWGQSDHAPGACRDRDASGRQDRRGARERTVGPQTRGHRPRGGE